MSGKTFKTVAGEAAPIRVVSFRRTCNGCPAQWEGVTDDGREVYARYRWSQGDVRVAAAGDKSEFAAVNGQYVCEWQREDDDAGGFDGFLTEEELRAVTTGHVEWPAKLTEEGAIQIHDEGTLLSEQPSRKSELTPGDGA